MKDAATRQQFIKLRAQGHSLRYIQRIIHVSRPTLIKWSRLYVKELDKERGRLGAIERRERNKELLQKLKRTPAYKDLQNLAKKYEKKLKRG